MTTTHNINRHFGALAERLAGRRRAPEGKGRILALEYFINSQRMKGFIREGKTHQVRAQMQTGRDDFAGIDISLARLVKKGLIRVEDGLNHCEDDGFHHGLIQVADKN